MCLYLLVRLEVIQNNNKHTLKGRERERGERERDLFAIQYRGTKSCAKTKYSHLTNPTTFSGVKHGRIREVPAQESLANACLPYHN